MDLARLLDFLLEAERAHLVKRETVHADGSRENIAEHSFQLCLLVLTFKEHLESYSFSRLLELALVHDLVEIYAGDTFAFDESRARTKAAREEEAARRLFSRLPSPVRERIAGLADEYAQASSPEARLVRLFDKIQPNIVNQVSAKPTWMRGVTLERIDRRVQSYLLGEDVFAEFHRLLMERASRLK